MEKTPLSFRVLDFVAFFIGERAIVAAVLWLMDRFSDDAEMENSANGLRVAYWRETGEWL